MDWSNHDEYPFKYVYTMAMVSLASWKLAASSCSKRAISPWPYLKDANERTMLNRTSKQLGKQIPMDDDDGVISMASAGY